MTEEPKSDFEIGQGAARHQLDRNHSIHAQRVC
jgi:hypothetical protein